MPSERMTTIRVRTLDGAVETVDLVADAVASLLARVAAHPCGGQITVYTSEEPQTELQNVVDVEVPGFKQILKFSQNAFFIFCQASMKPQQVTNPPLPKPPQLRVKKL